MLTGKQISEARKNKKLTQVQLANKMHVSTEAVSKWEKDVYSPKPENEKKLRKILQIPYFDEPDKRNAGRMFHERNMSAFIKGQFNAGCFPEATKALNYAKEAHEGQYRKPESFQIPYINHPLTMVCHALALGIQDDVIMAAILLHDVSEECFIKPETLPVCKEVQEIVRLVTKPGFDYKPETYYAAIEENPKACLVKCIDRCNNLSDMAIAFSCNHIRDYIKETEQYYPGLLRVVKQQPEYNNAAWLLGYQIRSVIRTAKRITE